MGREILKSFTANAIILAVLLLGSGRWNWAGAFVYAGIMAVLQMSVVLVVYRKIPDLMQERSKIQPGTKAWDKYILAGAAVIAPLAMYVVAALEVRFAWTAGMPPWLVAAGLAVCAAGGSVTFLAMLANRFFATTVRIQTDRGHKVVDAGPYGSVRHPGYTGIILFNVGTPFALGSWWALIPAGVASALFMLRTVLEDRTLQAELPGYREYAVRVRDRLVPGVW